MNTRHWSFTRWINQQRAFWLDKPQTLVKLHRNGSASFDIAGWLATDEGKRRLRDFRRASR